MLKLKIIYNFLYIITRNRLGDTSLWNYAWPRLTFHGHFRPTGMCSIKRQYITSYTSFWIIIIMKIKRHDDDTTKRQMRWQVHVMMQRRNNLTRDGAMMWWCDDAMIHLCCSVALWWSSSPFRDIAAWLRHGAKALAVWRRPSPMLCNRPNDMTTDVTTLWGTPDMPHIISMNLFLKHNYEGPLGLHATYLYELLT